MNFSKAIPVICLVLFTAFYGCQKSEPQYALEARTAQQITALLKWYELERPGERVTNLAQIFEITPRKYPYDWDSALRRYGKNAGFQHSIFEKYLFMSSGFTNRRVQGEILMLNAQPVPDQSGYGRIVISKVGTNLNDYRRNWISENIIQKIFAEAGVRIPVPTPMPLPPSAPVETDPVFMETKEPLVSMIRGNVVRFFEAYGMSTSAAWSVWYVLCTLPFVAIALTAILFWKRKAR